MARINAPTRSRCDGCQGTCRVTPTETQWHFDGNQPEYWQWSSRTLCPPCRSAQRDFWFGRARGRDQVVQLRLVSDVEAPIGVQELDQFRRTRPGYRKWLSSPWNQASS